MQIVLRFLAIQLASCILLAKRSHMGYSRKNPNRRVENIIFWKKTPGIFRFVTLPLEIPDKMKLHPWKLHKIVLHQLEFPRPKAKTHGIPHDFFWILPVNFTSFYIDPRNFHILFIQCPYLEIPCPQTPCLDFFLEQHHNHSFLLK